MGFGGKKEDLAEILKNIIMTLEKENFFQNLSGKNTKQDIFERF